MIQTILAYGAIAALGLTSGGVLTYNFTSATYTKEKKELAQKFGEAHEAILREITRIKGLDDRAYNEAVAEVNNEEFVSQITNQLNTIAAGENLEPVSSDNMQALINTLQHTLALETFLAKVRRNHELNQILGEDHTPDDIPAHLLATREEIKARYGNIITRQGAEIADLTSQLEAEKAQVKRIHERLKASKNESSRKTRKIKELERENTELKGAIEKLTEVNLGLTTQLDEVTQRLGRISQDNAQLQSKMKKVSQDNEQLQSRVTNLESNMQSGIKTGIKNEFEAHLGTMMALLKHIPEVKAALESGINEQMANSVRASVILQARHEEDENLRFNALNNSLASNSIDEATRQQIQDFLNELPGERSSIYADQFNQRLHEHNIRLATVEEGNWVMASLNNDMDEVQITNRGASFTERLWEERANSIHGRSVRSEYAPL